LHKIPMIGEHVGNGLQDGCGRGGVSIGVMQNTPNGQNIVLLIVKDAACCLNCVVYLLTIRLVINPNNKIPPPIIGKNFFTLL